MQQFALNALLHELLHAADVSLQNLTVETSLQAPSGHGSVSKDDIR